MNSFRKASSTLLFASLFALGCAAGTSPPLTGADGATGSDGATNSDAAGDLNKQDAPAGCGNGTCEPQGGEACDSCPSDCGTCQPCPAGFGDCNNMRLDGCETNLNNSMHCGACNAQCQPVGGTNPCVLNGTSMTYACQPQCDATHADCDTNPNNGCETDITQSSNCGACGATCVNPHGSTTCSTMGAGYFCVPTCDNGWAACGAVKDGCTTNTTNDLDNCGSCGRTCSSLHASVRACTAGSCAPTCQAPWSNCTTPLSPAIDNGCETNGLQDPGELDNNCAGARTVNVDEGDLIVSNSNRILPDADTDSYRINLFEGSSLCLPFSDQFFQARVVLVSPDGDMKLRASDPSVVTCSNTWKTYSNYMCLTWQGTCGFTDDVTVFFQVYGENAAQSCQPYELFVEYCFEGTNCPGC